MRKVVDAAGLLVGFIVIAVLTVGVIGFGWAQEQACATPSTVEMNRTLIAEIL